MAGQSDPEFANQLRAAINRLKAYLDAGMADEVRSALSTKRISDSTMRNWLRKPEKLLTSYRRTEFVDAVMKLPDLDQKRRNEAYEFALKELGVVRDGQRDLAGYRGAYRVFHDFEGVELHNIVIRVEDSPFVVVFAFRYVNKPSQYSNQGRRRRRRTCDGLVVLRHGRLVCTGFSRTTVFQAVFGCVGYPDTDLIRGMAFIDDVDANEVRFSRIVIARNPTQAASRDAEDYVRASGQSL
jgi:hypothetical protein